MFGNFRVTPVTPTCQVIDLAQYRRKKLYPRRVIARYSGTVAGLLQYLQMLTGNDVA